MAVVSSNKRGNPYHDEKTGKFTSAGLGAIAYEVKNKTDDSQKEYLNELYRRAPGKTENEKIINMINRMDVKDFNFYVDSFFSIPNLIQNFNLARGFDRSFCKENHNSLLDKTGVDFIAYDKDIGFLKNENLFDYLDLIDVKTTFTDSVKLNVFQLVDKEQDVLKDVLANPNLKGNNYYLMTFMNVGQKTNIRDFIKHGIIHGFGGKSVPTDAYRIDKQDLIEVIYSNIDMPGIISKAEEIDGDLSGLSYDKFVDKWLSDFDFSEQGGGRYLYSKPIGDTGLAVEVSITPEENRYGFRMEVSMNKSFIHKYFVNNKLTPKINS